MIKRITLLLLILPFIACKKSGKDSNNEKEKMKAARFLIGNWEMITQDGHLKELWDKQNDSIYIGQSYFIKAKDTIHFEKIQLEQKGDILTYTTIIKGQNNDKPISFMLMDYQENKVVFENKANDYPQKITYSQNQKGNLVTELAGIQSGKTSTERYEMKKIK
ncbi:DUF6265 family protein [Flavobacterium frigidarium]|uniref:DUF6265 family protein n=1 Tax=Flavobacterium frigidarium TaxID=99286 RepID=UPI0030D89D3B|tara:strand:- start:3626 stop:4114 length:489 start_codon:yes stop_codon:yes gene_type:complete